MGRSEGTGKRTTVPPEAAFEILGNEVRVRILRTLGEADGSLSFTEIRDRVGLRHGGKFNYHLDRLTGHFVERTDEGYALRRPGERVVQAVLSGAVTETPVVERTQIDQPCHSCGAPIEVQFGRERVEMFCTECGGGGGEEGFLGYRFLPPAGVRERTPAEMFEVAYAWTNLDILAIGNRICPRCSGILDRSRTVSCAVHDTTGDGRECEECGRLRGVALQYDCRNCTFDVEGSLNVHLLNEPTLLAFLSRHGHDPIAPDSPMVVQRLVSNYDEQVLSTDPLEMTATFSVDGDALTLRMAEDLHVVETSEHRARSA